MKIFIGVIVAAVVIGGFVGGELMDRTFSITGAVVGGVGLAAILLGLGAFFDAQERKKRKVELTPEIRGVFDRMLGKNTAPTQRAVSTKANPNRSGQDFSVPQLTREQMLRLTRDYLEVRSDEGASGHPADYAASLEYVSPASDFPGKWPQVPLCGCCSVPFAIDARRSGLWVAQGHSGKQSGTVVPICAVCITYLNRHQETSSQRVRFPLTTDYDAVGQEICGRFPLDDLTKLALVRVALVRKRLGESRKS